MQAPITHIIPAASIRRERLMPARGRIIARRGQQVRPTDVIAEAMIRPEHLSLDIARGLGLEPKNADHYIQHRAGDEVGEGDVIAGPVGMGRRVVRTPRSGTVVATGNGQVLLELEGEYTELKAGYFGVISEIIGDRGVAIDSVGSLIQGVWGNGQVNFGLLNLQAHSPDEIITPDMLEVGLRGSVIMAGICEDERVLLSAEEMPVRGLILASMDASLAAAALKVSYPVVLVEGFGRLPMNQDAFAILTSAAMREVAVNAEGWNRIGNHRPEVVVAVPEGTYPEFPTEIASFAVGQTVRVVRAPAKSMVGTLVTLPHGPSILPSGLRAPTAEVRLMSGDSIQVPLANLEIIG